MDQGPIIVLQEIRLNYQQNKMIDSPATYIELDILCIILPEKFDVC